MHLQIVLVLALTVSLAGISYIENVDAASGHNFESQWGKAGISKSGFFLSPQHSAFDSENNVYVTDLGNSRVQKFDSTGNFLTEWGNRGTNSGEFGHPTGIAVSDEFVFVVDNKNHNIQKFSLDGEWRYDCKCSRGREVDGLKGEKWCLYLYLGVESRPVHRRHLPHRDH